MITEYLSNRIRIAQSDLKHVDCGVIILQEGVSARFGFLSLYSTIARAASTVHSLSEAFAVTEKISVPRASLMEFSPCETNAVKLCRKFVSLCNTQSTAT